MKEQLIKYSRETTVGEILDGLNDLSKYEGHFYKQLTEDIVFGSSLDVFYAENLNGAFTGVRIHFSNSGTWIDKGYNFVFNPSTAEKIEHSEYAEYLEKSNRISEQIKKVIRDVRV